MKFASKTANSKAYFKEPNPGLRAYFHRVVRGQPDDYETPFAKGSNLHEIQSEWMREMESKLKDPIFESLLSFEKEMMSKSGPMSIMKPLKDRLEDIDNYYTLISLGGKPIRPEAIQKVVEEFKSIRGLTLRSQENVVRHMKLSTNSGSPEFTKRRVALKDTVPVSKVFTDANGVTWQILPDGEWGACAVLGWRGQEGGPEVDDVKQRVVWMFPMAVNIKELQFYQPLIEACQKKGLVAGWMSMDAVDQKITRCFDTKDKDQLIVCTDFSKFDQHFNNFLQQATQDIYRQLMSNDPANEIWLKEVFPIKFNIPLAINYGKVRRGKHGMGSGSGGTNPDEVMVHRSLQYEAAMNDGQELNPNSDDYGDDGYLTYPGITVDSVTRSYTAHGVDMNKIKQYASALTVIYLRRWHHTEYRIDGISRGVYATERAINRLKKQERYYDPESWGPKRVALRQLSIIENCCWHPLFEDFVEFCMKRDKYRLGIDIPGFLDNIEEEAKKAIDDMPDFLGYTKSMMNNEKGIKSWRVVKYLKSKR